MSDTLRHELMAFNGQSDTHIHSGKPYSAISLRLVWAMASTPTDKPKANALALMASGYNAHDGRDHKVQREQGRFLALRVDVDKGTTALADLRAALFAFAGDGAALCIYSTSSATVGAPRWRGLIPLADPVAYDVWLRLQRALHLHLTGCVIDFDISMERAGQYFAAPNVPLEKRDADGQPLFYQFDTCEGEALNVSAAGCVAALAGLDALDARANQARAEAAKRAVARRNRPGASTGHSGLIDAVNDRYSVADCFRRFGFDTKNGNDWHHPQQTSTSYSWRDCGEHWVCISSMARDHGIGMVTASGFGAGDAFDLICHFEHGGDVGKAIKALANQIDVTDPATGEVQTWHDRSKADWAAHQVSSGPTFSALEDDGEHASATTTSEPDPHRNAPRPHDGCLYGLVGDVARAACMANKEVNPHAAALAFMTLLAAGLGRGCYQSIGDDWHHPRLFALHVGRSGRGRKGTSTKLATRIARSMDDRHPDVAFQRHTGGLSSREGLVMKIHDGFKEGKNEVEPIHDKRLWILESEFANTLHQTGREGNTLSAALRDAWDGSCIKPATKTAPVYASKPHINLLGHITPSELVDMMKSRELSNGFANRFLMIWAEQGELDPFPSYTPKETIEALTDRLADVLRFAQADRFADRDHTRLQLDSEAAKRYAALYRGEFQDRSGGELVTGLLVRRAPYLLRLAMLFALTDKADTIGLPHLEAALHWVRFWAESVRFIFASAAQEAAFEKTQDAAQRIIDFLGERSEATRTELTRECFGGRVSRDVLDAAIDDLLKANPPAIEVEQHTRKDGPGRGTKVYRKTTAKYANSAKYGAGAGLQPENKAARTLRTMRNVVNTALSEPDAEPDFAPKFANFAATENTVQSEAGSHSSQTSQSSHGLSESAVAPADDMEVF